MGLGYLFDQLTFNKNKSKAYSQIINLGRKIQKASFPELANIIIKSFNRLVFKIFDFKNRFFLSIVLVLVFSWLATSLFSVFGKYQSLMVSGFDLEDYRWHDYLPMYSTYIVNIAFDFLTIFITVKIFTYIVEKAPVFKLLFIVLDLIVAFFLAYLCYVCILETNKIEFPGHDKFARTSYNQKNQNNQYYFSDVIRIDDKVKLSNWLGSENRMKVDLEKVDYAEIIMFDPYVSPKYYIERVYNSLKNSKYVIKSTGVLKVYSNEDIQQFTIQKRVEISNGFLFISLSTFLPSAIFFAILIFIMTSKMVFNFSKWLSHIIIGTMTENVDQNKIQDFKPGTHIAKVLGVIVAVLNLLIEIST